MIYELFHLCREDWILQNTRTLPTNGGDHSIKRQAVVLTYIGESKTRRAIHSCLTVDIDNPVQGRLSQKGPKERFKQRIPVQNVVLMTVYRIYHGILVGMTGFPPHRTVDILCAINDVCDSVSFYEKRG
jgi:hypothetical protein